MSNGSPLWPAGPGCRVLSIGECMVEITEAGTGGISYGYAGDTLNTAVYLAREFSGTASQIDYLTALGDDQFSERMLVSWQSEGIGTDRVVRLSGELPGLYWVSTSESGERSFSYWRSQSAARKLMRNITQFRESMALYNLVYLSGITLAILDDESRELLLQLLGEMRRGGALVVYDSNYRPALWTSVKEAQEWLLRLAAMCEVGLVSLEDETTLFDDDSAVDTIARLKEHGVTEIVVKDGERMCTATSGTAIENYAVEQVGQVDTTAAGDSFNAAYIAARIRGETQESAVSKAQKLAARVIQYRGAIVPA
jgi:2-dehydro-3-deoxygluconokinase